MPSLFFVVLGAWFCFPTFECKHVCQGAPLGEEAERARVGKPGSQGGEGEGGTAERRKRQPDAILLLEFNCIMLINTWR